MKSLTRRHWLDILRISIFILLFVAIFRLLPPRGSGQVSTTNVVEIQAEGQPPAMYAFNLWVSYLPPESTANNRLQVRLLELDYARLDGAAEAQPAGGRWFCLTELDLAQMFFTPELLSKERNISAPVEENPFCAEDLEVGTIRFPNIDEFIFEAIDEPNTVWYPYDDFRFNLAVQVSYAIFDESRENVLFFGAENPATYRVSVEGTNWKYQMAMDRTSGEDGETPFLETSFGRNFLTRAFPVVLISIIYLFILVLYYVEQMSTLLEGSLAALFGIFGVRQVILPASIETQTIWDFLIFLAYICLVITFLFKYVVLRMAAAEEEEEEGESRADE